jgi:hypothetical protein
MNSIQIIIKMNHNTYRKQFSAVVLGLFLLGMTNAFGQLPDPSTTRKITTDRDLSEHGFTSAGLPSDGEKTDSVTVGSTMPYFIMPDANYNSKYFAQNSYAATDLTTSKFNWDVNPGSGVVAAKNENGTDTSPWVEIKWSATGLVEVSMTEESQNVSCISDAVKIPVQVIQKPEIMFGEIANERKFTECVPDVNNHTYDFQVVPLTNGVITQSSGVKITYDLEFAPLGGGASTQSNGNIAEVSNGSFTLELKEHGTYTIVIKSVSDKISRKCTFDAPGDAFNLGTADEEKFVYTMLPKPTPGKAYHVPNN